MNLQGGGTRVFISEVHDPWWNQAMEDFLFSERGDHSSFLFLWSNRPCVVIGRFQNPWVECHVKKMQEAGVDLVRRTTGGGTVFHDLGNMNFGFLVGRKGWDRRRNLEVVRRALTRIPVQGELEINDRYDLLIDGKKISGSAFRESGPSACHHGTLLMQADLKALTSFLSPPPQGISSSRGIPSKKSRVTNLREHSAGPCSFSTLVPLLAEEFFQEFGAGKIQVLGREETGRVPAVQRNYEKWKGWEWCFGETPQFQKDFSARLPCGQVEGSLVFKKGIIHQFSLQGDHLGPEETGAVCRYFEGRPYKRGEFFPSDESWPGQAYQSLSQLRDWVIQEILA